MELLLEKIVLLVLICAVVAALLYVPLQTWNEVMDDFFKILTPPENLR